MTGAAPVRVALVGAGWYGALAHAPAVADDPAAELVAVCDRDRDRAREVADTYAVPHVFDDLGTLVRAGVADAVVLAVPHRAHHPLARTALDAGLHVLVEKPMTLTAADAWDLVERSERARLALVVGHTYHFTTAAARVRQRLRAGAIGEVVQISGTYCSPTERLFRGEPAQTDGRGGSYGDPAEMGGGQGYTQLAHLLALALWTTELTPAEVFAYMNQHGLAVDLVDSVAVRFTGGALGSFAATGTAPAGHPPHQTLTYYGTRGMVHHDIPHGQAQIRVADTPEEQVTLAPDEPRYPLGGPVRTLIGLASGRSSENPAPGAVGARTVEILEAAYRSAVDGQPYATGTTGHGVLEPLAGGAA